MQLRLPLASIGFCAAGCLLAQPTLTALNNVPTPGSEFPESIGTFEDVGPAGPDQVYGFWNMVPTGNRNYNYLDPSVTATSAQAPTATLLSTDGGSDTLFWNVTAQGLTQVADRTELTGMVSYSDPLLEIAYPCTFGTTWNDVVSASYTAQGFPVTRVGTMQGIADAYGELVLPAAIVQNVLRVKVTRNITDQAALGSIIRNSTTYYFFTELVPHPVLRLQLDTVTIFSGAPASTSQAYWMYGNGQTSIGELNIDDVQFTAYPNPASDVVNLNVTDGSQARSVEVMDATGRLVLQLDLGASGTSGQQGAFNVSGLVTGIYLVRIMDGVRVLGTQRLVVQ